MRWEAGSAWPDPWGHLPRTALDGGTLMVQPGRGAPPLFLKPGDWLVEVGPGHFEVFGDYEFHVAFEALPQPAAG